MAVPGFQRMMLPLLQLASDGSEHTASESFDVLASKLGLSEEDRREMLPSGGQQTFENRVGWARTYLTKAGLLESTGRARFKITGRGQEVLATHPTEIGTKFLRRFPEFCDFQNRQAVEPELDEQEEEGNQTPEEALDTIYQRLRRTLAQDLLARIKTSTPRFFEQLVVDLLVAMGYGGSRKDAGQAVGQSGDGGIDGIIKEDKLGLDVVYVQAKRWDNVVGRPIVQAFAGSLEGQRARKGVLITTSQFSQEARDYVSRIEKKIVLIDGEQLAQYLIEHGVGVTESASYTVKRLDLDYFGGDQ